MPRADRAEREFPSPALVGSWPFDYGKDLLLRTISLDSEEGTMATIPRTWLLVALGMVIVASAFATSTMAVPSGTSVRPAKAVSITLHGSTSSGWGFGPNNITTPGPSWTVDQGDVIAFTLFAQDSVPHTLVLDLNANGVKDAGDLESGPFSSPTTGVTFSYTANVAGTHQYFCGVHGASVMKGPFTVRAAPPPPADNTLLIVGGVVVVVVIVGAAAAMMMRRKKKPGP